MFHVDPLCPPTLPPGLPRWCSSKESTCQCRRCKRCRFNLWVRKIPQSRKWQPNPMDRRAWWARDTTEWLNKSNKSNLNAKKSRGRKEGARGEWREEGKNEGKRNNTRKERKGKVKELLLITKKYENLKLEKPFPPLSLVLWHPDTYWASFRTRELAHDPALMMDSEAEDAAPSSFFLLPWTRTPWPLCHHVGKARRNLENLVLTDLT